MKVYKEETLIDDVLIIKNEIFHDERGFFKEVYNKDEFKNIGLPHKFVQLNHSRSAKNILRGLHFQWEPQMGKLMRVTKGEAYLVAVDIRIDSHSFGKWYGKILSEDDQLQIWVVGQFDHISDMAEQPRFTPMLRFFYRTVLWEMGCDLQGIYWFQMMAHF